MSQEKTKVYIYTRVSTAMQIDLLEVSLGVRLFERTRRPAFSGCGQNRQLGIIRLIPTLQREAAA